LKTPVLEKRLYTDEFFGGRAEARNFARHIKNL
jgi:hypothetical protein